jgi:deoxyribonuclease IV
MSLEFRFGTVGSPISTPKKPGGSVGAVEQIKTLNLDALELGWVQSVRVSPETCEAIRDKSIKNNVLISVHAPYFINLNASEEEWLKSRKRLMDAAYYGNLAGATDIVFHPGSYFGEAAEVVLEKVISRLNNCVVELQSSQNSVTLRPETMGKIAMLGSLEDTLIMSSAIKGVFPCLDFAHLHARAGDGSVNTTREFEDILNLYAKYLGEKALQSLHIHLSGIEYSAKGERNHLPIKESDMNIAALFTALHKLNCSGRILCESPILEEDALYLKELWQKQITL